jgi:hypothetical protein
MSGRKAGPSTPLKYASLPTNKVRIEICAFPPLPRWNCAKDGAPSREAGPSTPLKYASLRMTDWFLIPAFETGHQK